MADPFHVERAPIAPHHPCETVSSGPLAAATARGPIGIHPHCTGGPDVDDRTPHVACAPMRWPLEPLLELTGHTTHTLGKALGISGSWVKECRTTGLSDLVADRWACRLGHHPSAVWPDWFDAVLTEVDRCFVWGAPGAEPGWRRSAGYEVAA